MCLNTVHNTVRVSLFPLVARSKAWFSGISFDGVTGSNPAGGHGCLCVVSDGRGNDHSSTGVLTSVLF
jgi:hypothetical protein